MSTDHRLERLLTEVLDAGAPPRPPDRLEPETLRALRRVRRWPRWLALLKESPMRTNSHLAVGSPTARVAVIVVATLLLALTIAGAGIAGSRLLAADGAIIVAPDGSGHYTSIQEAVAAAEDGDEILVRPGTYDESILLDKDITIRGDGERDAVVVELSVEMRVGVSGSTPDLPVAFLFDGSDATLENLTVRGESARIVISGGDPLLQDLVLDGIGRVYSLDPGQPTPTGLELNDGTTATVTHSVLIDTDVDIETGSSPSLLENEFSIGAVWMEGAGVNPAIRDNVIEDSVKWGISVGGGAQPEVIGNTILNAQTGIDIQDAGYFTADRGTNPMIRENTIVGSGRVGIAVSAMATIDGNELTGNATGIRTSYSDPALLGNTVSGGSVGIVIAGGSPRLEANEIEGTERGLVIVSGTTPTLEGNTVCDNEANLVVHDGVEMPDMTGNEICEDDHAE